MTDASVTIEPPITRRERRSSAFHVVDSPSSQAHAAPQRASLRSGFAWLTAGNVVSATCSWARIAILAHLGNSEMIGQFALALAICTPIDTLADLGLGGALVSDARREFRYAHYLTLRMITAILTLLTLAVMAGAGSYDAPTAHLIVSAGLFISIESLCDILESILQRHERMDLVAVSLMLRSIAGIAFFAIGTWWTGSLAIGVCGFSIAAIGSLLFDVLWAARIAQRSGILQGRFTASAAAHSVKDALRGLPRLAWVSLPLGLATASLALGTSIPRFLVNHYLGERALGAFAVAGGLMVATALVVGALSQAAGPRLADFHAGGDRAAFLRLLGRLLICVALAGAVSVLVMEVAGRQILGLLYGAKFARYADIAVWLTFAAAVRNLTIPLGRAITSMRSFRTNLTIRIAGLAILLAMLPGWIQWLGLLGAAYALALTWTISALISMAVILRSYGPAFEIR